MLSLNVASERAELAKLERSIIMAKQDIRTLQTELGTRGRLQQLESWNANVLALSAPTSAQFLDNELTLARFDQREQSIEERSVVHMASAPAPAPAAPQVRAKIEAPVRYAAAPAAPRPEPSLVHQASLVVGGERPALATDRAVEKSAVAAPAKAGAAEAKTVLSAEKKATETAKKKPLGISGKLVRDIGEAAKSEKNGSAGGQ
jgi:hypothetical protein